MKTNLFAAFVAFLVCFNVHAQTDSLAHYSLRQLDSIYHQLDQQGKLHQSLPYTLALLSKGRQQLNQQDTAFAKILYKVGQSYNWLNKNDSALAYYQQAEAIQTIKIPQHLDYAGVLQGLGAVYYRTNKYQLAIRCYETCLQIIQDTLGAQHPRYAKIRSFLGDTYTATGQFDLAKSNLKQALQIQKKVLGNYHADIAFSTKSLGILYWYMGNYATAELYFKESLQCNLEVFGRKHRSYADALNNLAILYWSTANYTNAEILYKEALQTQRELFGNDHINCTTSMVNLAGLYHSLGNHSAAKSLYEQALAIIKNTFGEKHASYATTSLNLSILYNGMGDLAMAETLCKEAVAIRKELLGSKHLLYLGALHNLAAIYQQHQKNDLSEAIFKEILATLKETVGEQHPDYANSLQGLGEAYFLSNQYDSSIYTLENALSIRKEILGENHPNYMMSLHQLGLVYSAAGSYDTAQAHFARLLSLRIHYLLTQGSSLGEKAKQAFLKKAYWYINNVYHFAAFHRQNDSLLTLLQDGSLQAKSYSLSSASSLLPLIKNLNDSTLNATYEAWIYTKQQLGKAYEMSPGDRIKRGIKLDSLEALAADQESALVQASAVLRERLGYDKKQFHYKDLVASIAKKEVAIDFVRFENTKGDTAWYYALITQPEWAFPKYIPLCLESQLLPYTNSLIAPNSPSYITQATQSKELYQLLIQPLEPYLQKKKIVHWAPAGIMNQIALGTLRDAKGKMLGEKMELHQYGSLKDFILKKTTDGSTGSSNQNVLLVGDIAFDLEEAEHKNLAENNQPEILYASRGVDADSSRSGTMARFSRLAGTKVELEHLHTAFSSKKWTIEQLKEKDALEERVRTFSGSNTPRVLHFATHGFFVPAKKQGEDNPLLRSGIALAGANRVWTGRPRIDGVEDGLWTAYEIANIDLSPAELIVLSACETARGQIDPHEGVVGLQRAFKIAGVDNMLLSLWQVPDKETVELMQFFYQYYLDGKTPAVSLHKAQAAMRKRHPNPYYWAAFILIE